MGTTDPYEQALPAVTLGAMSAPPEHKVGLGLEEQLCFALYAAYRAVLSSYRPLLSGVSLTFPQYLVMLVLWGEPRQTMRQIGKRLYLDSGTLSPLIKRLEGEGLVHRERGTDDERMVVVSLTEKGSALRPEVEGFPPCVAASTGLAPQRLEAIRDELQEMADYMLADGPAPPQLPVV